MRILCGLLALSTLLAAPERQGKAAPEKNVLDWYLEVPNKYLHLTLDSDPSKELSSQERRKLIKTLDIANGYIAVSDDDLVDDYAAALFKRRSGTPFLGITSDGVSVQRSAFVERTASGGWREITKQVLPEFTDEFILAKYNEAF